MKFTLGGLALLAGSFCFVRTYRALQEGSFLGAVWFLFLAIFNTINGYLVLSGGY